MLVRTDVSFASNLLPFVSDWKSAWIHCTFLLHLFRSQPVKVIFKPVIAFQKDARNLDTPRDSWWFARSDFSRGFKRTPIESVKLAQDRISWCPTNKGTTICHNSCLHIWIYVASSRISSPLPVNQKVRVPILPPCILLTWPFEVPKKYQKHRRKCLKAFWIIFFCVTFTSLST